ncbi:MAG: DNA-processing protein DprA, partial [Kiritimatiellae bacterium]|nr:DNA-processing protein DprA [Kiritimatiellia bacterium]
MTEREALIVMNMVPGLGAITAKRMAGRFGSLAAVFEASEAELAEVQGMSIDKAGQFLAALRQVRADQEIDKAERSHVKLITWADEGYPELLKRISDPPLALYVAGSVEALDMPAVAIIGTRRPTVY